MSTYELSYDYLLLVRYANRNTYHEINRYATYESAYRHAHIIYRHSDVEAVQVIHIYSPYYSSLILDLQNESDYDPEGLTPFYPELNPEHTEIAEPSPVYQALLFQDDDLAPYKTRARSIDRTLSKIRILHEELNSALYTRPTDRPTIHSPADAAEILSPFICFLDHEELWVMVLDTRNRVSKLVKLYVGSVNSSTIRTAEVFRQAVLENMPSILLAHNHPSGDPSPSPEDISSTKFFIEAGKILDIEVLDHIIITRNDFFSLKLHQLGGFK